MTDHDQGATVTGTRRKTIDAAREDLLGTSPFDDDLSDRLSAGPRPRRRPPSVTILLGAGVLIVGGFIGGVQADRHWGAKKNANPADLIRQFQARGGARGGFGGGNFPGAGQRTGQGGGQNGGSRASTPGTSGTVKLVDGDVIYVQTADGIVRVKTTGSTKVTVAKKSSVKSLKTGSPIVVQGTPGQDGTVTASSVSQGG